jgi:hypothetical protein
MSDETRRAGSASGVLPPDPFPNDGDGWVAPARTLLLGEGLVEKHVGRGIWQTIAG